MRFVKISIVLPFIILLLVGSVFYFHHQTYFSRGSLVNQKIFEIEKGNGNVEIAERLQKEGFISNKYYLYYYIRKNNLLNKIMPGEYQLSGQLTIPEIVTIITNSQEQFIKITFPEGFTAEQMAERLSANALPGDEFLKIVKNPGELRNRYSYLTSEKVETLEGYLFPDTYFFKKEIEAKDIVGRLLDTFNQKLDETMRVDATKENRTINSIVIMASIVQKEVRTSADMKTAAGVFWKRVDAGGRLQSDATLSYILNDKVDQHSGKDLEFDSPYNSYLYSGLPPGPINNPGLDALNAAIYPTDSSYNFFLTATVNGEKKVFFSVTYEEHLAAKRKYGL